VTTEYSSKVNMEDVGLDIFVPVHGKLEITTNCIKSIYENTQTPFHLIIADSPDKPVPDKILTSAFIEGVAQRYNNVTIIKKQEVDFKTGNEFFNAALAHCQTDFMATVMNSTAVQPDWDIAALDIMRRQPEVGIIGFKAIYPHNNLIESAGIAMDGFTPIDIARDFPTHRQCGVYECIAVQWAFALVRKQAVVGNLEEDTFFGHVGWDDIDNCFEVRKKGWKILYCGIGAGYHSVRATRGNDSLEAAVKNLYNAHTFYRRQGYWELFLKTCPNATIKTQLEAMETAIPKFEGEARKRIETDLKLFKDGLVGVGR
jgi:GT2 family glycosyltransferase